MEQRAFKGSKQREMAKKADLLGKRPRSNKFKFISNDDDSVNLESFKAQIFFEAYAPELADVNVPFDDEEIRRSYHLMLSEKRMEKNRNSKSNSLNSLECEGGEHDDDEEQRNKGQGMTMRQYMRLHVTDVVLNSVDDGDQVNIEPNSHRYMNYLMQRDPNHFAALCDIGFQANNISKHPLRYESGLACGLTFLTAASYMESSEIAWDIGGAADANFLNLASICCLKLGRDQLSQLIKYYEKDATYDNDNIAIINGLRKLIHFFRVMETGGGLYIGSAAIILICGPGANTIAEKISVALGLLAGTSSSMKLLRGLQLGSYGGQSKYRDGITVLELTSDGFKFLGTLSKSIFATYLLNKGGQSTITAALLYGTGFWGKFLLVGTPLCLFGILAFKIPRLRSACTSIINYNR